MSQLTTLEYDRTLIPVLEQELAEFSQVEIRAGNILDINWDTEAEPDIPLMLFGNLPYHLSSDIILSLIDSPKSWRRACFMVQKEFGERLAASAGTRQSSALSVQPNYSHIHRLLSTSHPPLSYQHQKSTLVSSLSSLDGTYNTSRFLRAFRTVVRALFGQRRKMARRALKTLDVEPQHLLANAGMDGSRRGETFNLDELTILAQAYLSIKAG